MSYTAVGTTIAQQRAAAAAAAREASRAAFYAQQGAAVLSMPQCIPERYRQAAANWCTERQTVAGLGQTDWELPQEYMGDPCIAKDLPSCPAGVEPALTPTVMSTSSESTSSVATPTYTTSAAAPINVAAVKTNYLMWGIIGGVGVLALLVWRASK